MHAIFGAFIAGAAMPRARNLHIGLAGKVEDVVIAVFMPLYFAFSGLRTDFTKLNDGQSWGIAFLVIVVASVGKLGGCSIASRISGLSWRESVGIGLLMNCKGLVELIVLNVGLDLGVISPVVRNACVASCGYLDEAEGPHAHTIASPDCNHVSHVILPFSLSAGVCDLRFHGADPDARHSAGPAVVVSARCNPR